MALNQYGWWYVENGTINFNYTGMAENEYGWWYVTDGALDLTYTGMALNKYGWWYLTDGTVDFTYNGMAENEFGWWKITGGAVDLSFNGIASNQYGSWKMAGGTVDFGYTGSIEYNGKTYNVAGGYVTGSAGNSNSNDTSDDTGNTGDSNNSNTDNGNNSSDNNNSADNNNDSNNNTDNGNTGIDTNLNGLTYDEATNLWYYYINGVLDVNNNGLVEYNGYLFKLADGVLDVAYTGTYYNDGMYYYVDKGAVKTSAAEGTDEAKLLAINKFEFDKIYTTYKGNHLLTSYTYYNRSIGNGVVVIQFEGSKYYNMSIPKEYIDIYGIESFYGLETTLNTIANINM